MTESIPSEALKVADELLHALDEVARDCDHYDYGLPMHDDWKDKLRALVLAALASPSPATGALTDTQVIAMNPYLNDDGRRALWLAAFRFAERHHGITAASQVEPEDKP
jgi:hypothetical protein